MTICDQIWSNVAKWKDTKTYFLEYNINVYSIKLVHKNLTAVASSPSYSCAIESAGLVRMNNVQKDAMFGTWKCLYMI